MDWGTDRLLFVSASSYYNRQATEKQSLLSEQKWWYLGCCRRITRVRLEGVNQSISQSIDQSIDPLVS